MLPLLCRVIPSWSFAFERVGKTEAVRPYRREAHYLSLLADESENTMTFRKTFSMVRCLNTYADPSAPYSGKVVQHSVARFPRELEPMMRNHEPTYITLRMTIEGGAHNPEYHSIFSADLFKTLNIVNYCHV